MALDTNEDPAGHLAQLWDTSPVPADAGPGLFSSPVQAHPSTRHRHAQAPPASPRARVLGSDVEQLDALARGWGAGSRGVLVEAAAGRYLTPDEPVGRLPAGRWQPVLLR